MNIYILIKQKQFLFLILIVREDYVFYLLYFIKLFSEIIDNVIPTIKQQNLLYFILRRLILYSIYIVLALIIYLIKRFAIFFAIFSLYIKYSEIALRYIYNNLNIKNCIAILIRKQKLKKFFVETILKNQFVFCSNYI